MLQHSNDEAMLCLQTPALGCGQTFGRKFKRGKVNEGVLGPLQPLLQVCAEGREHGGALRIRPQNGYRIRQ